MPPRLECGVCQHRGKWKIVWTDFSGQRQSSTFVHKGSAIVAYNRQKQEVLALRLEAAEAAVARVQAEYEAWSAAARDFDDVRVSAKNVRASANWAASAGPAAAMIQSAHLNLWASRAKAERGAAKTRVLRAQRAYDAALRARDAAADAFKKVLAAAAAAAAASETDEPAAAAVAGSFTRATAEEVLAAAAAAASEEPAAAASEEPAAAASEEPAGKAPVWGATPPGSTPSKTAAVSVRALADAVPGSPLAADADAPAAAQQTQKRKKKKKATKEDACLADKLVPVPVEKDGDCAFTCMAIANLALWRKRKASELPLTGAEDASWLHDDIERKASELPLTGAEDASWLHGNVESQRKAWSNSEEAVELQFTVAQPCHEGEAASASKRVNMRTEKALRGLGAKSGNNKEGRTRSGAAHTAPPLPTAEPALPSKTLEETRTAMKAMGINGGLWGDESALQMGSEEIGMRVLVTNETEHVAVIGPEKSTSLAIFRLKNNHYSILSCNSDVAWDEGDVLPAAVEKVAKRAFRAGWPRSLL